MKRILIIETCNECHHFDNEYYSYMETCDKLDRTIKRDEAGERPIPEDCPLEIKQETK